MSKGSFLTITLGMLVAGIFIGNAMNSKPRMPAQGLAAAPDPNVERFKVPLGAAPAKGPEHAKITIVEWSDFQCPFCARSEPTVQQVLQTYGKDVRILWKQQPLLQLHPDAMPAAQLSAAVYAKRGNDAFWRLHDTLYAHQRALGRADLERYGKEAGLDDADLKAALDDKKYDAAIAADMAEGHRFGAHGTPAFFVNGRMIYGAEPFAKFKTVIDEELANADRALAQGATLATLYDVLTVDGKTAATPPPARPQEARRPSGPDVNTVYRADVGDAPSRGADAKHAKVTIVEWSDFQCPFCGRAEPVVDDVLKQHGRDVRVVFKQQPLSMHANAHLAAEAALAAKAQGKFWPLHDRLFAHQRALDRASLEKYAAEAGLDVARFKSELDAGTWRAKVDAESAEGNRLGASGTPAFFINGKPLIGYVPTEAFLARVDAALSEADAKAHGDFPRYYAELMKTAQASVTPPPAPTTVAPLPAAVEIEPGRGPALGKPKAPVTIVEFSDFECPYCARIVPTLKQLQAKYPDQLRIVWRNFPLGMHPDAALAAEAGMAAAAQGKFWPMHDAMFAHQHELDRASLEKYARAIGLDVRRFESDLDTHRWQPTVAADEKYGESLGLTGTPSFFVDGKKLVGGLPFEQFAALVDRELKEGHDPTAALTRRP